MTRKKRMCKRLWSMLIIVALLMANVCGDFRTLRVEAEIANPNINYVNNSSYASVHDPVILQENGTYYMYSTGIIGHGVELRTSTDMVSWNYVSSFATQHDDELKTSEVMAATGNGMTNIWAPDVVKVGDEYWMFYSCSASGSRNSCIALAKASNPQGPFTYDGIVIQTSNSTASNMNAIDACIEYDQEGRMWMAYGSFFGGIRVVELNATTGYRKSQTDEGTLIASRPYSIDNGSLEGPIIRYHDGYYYLFVSYDNLFGVERGGGGSYHVRVGRSTTINGTYVDQDGVSMIQAAETTGYKLTANYKFNNATGWWAVGHCDIFEDTNGKWQYVSHARVNGNQNAPYSYIHQLLWNKDGWPIISPEPYVGETIKSMTVADAAGKYERIAFHDNKETLANTLTSVEMNLNSDYSATIEGVAGTGTWNFTGDNTVTVTIGDLKEVYTLMEGWDAENNKSTMVLTGNDMSGTNTGLQRWGKRIEVYDAPGYTVTVNANNNSYGTVSGGQTVNAGESVTVTANASVGYNFVHWVDENDTVVSTNATYTYQPTGNDDLTAMFSNESKPVITVVTNNSEYGTVSGGNTVNVGEKITIVATPKGLGRFVSWKNSKGQIISKEETFTTRVYESDTITAYFEAISDYYVADYMTDGTSFSDALDTTGQTKAYLDGEAEVTNETVVVKGTAGDATPKDYVRMVNPFKNSEENAVSLVAYMSIHENEEYDYKTLYTFYTDVGFLTITANGGIHFNDWSGNYFDDDSQTWTPDGEQHLYSLVVTKNSISVYEDSTLINKYNCASNVLSFIKSCEYVSLGTGNDTYTDEYGGWAWGNANTATSELLFVEAEIGEHEFGSMIYGGEPCIVSAITDGNGTVTSPQEDVNAGKTATVTAMANIGYKFAYWTDEQGNKVSTNAIYTFKVTRDITLQANFLPESSFVDISVNTEDVVKGTVTGSINDVIIGNDVTIKATPTTYYKFVGWRLNGEIVSTDAVYTFKAKADASYTAVFELDTDKISTTSFLPQSDDRLLAYYPFNESLTNVKTGQNAGTVSAGGTGVASAANYNKYENYTVNGVMKTSVNLQVGTYGYELAKNANVPNSTEDYTISFWMKTNNMNMANASVMHLCNFETGDKLSIAMNSTAFSNNCIQTISKVDGATTNKSSTVVASSGTWMNIILTVDSGTGTLYINGNKSITDISVGDIFTSSNYAMYTGVTDDAMVQYFYTALDEVYLYNGALSESEIAILANSGNYNNGDFVTARITISSNIQSAGTLYGAGDVIIGNEATVIARPNAGYRFINWTTQAGIVLTNTEVYNFSPSGDITLVAVFEEEGGGGPEATPTPTPVVTPTPEPVVTPTPEPVVTPTPTPVVTPTPTPVVTPTPEPVVTPTPEPVVTPTPTPVVTPTPNKQTLTAEQQQLLLVTVNEKNVEKLIKGTNTDKGDPKGSLFAKLQLKATGKKKSVKLSWKKVKNADGYIIYGSACGSKMKKLKTITKGTVNKWTNKKLKKGKFYKYIIVAYYNVAGEKRIAYTSKSVHAITSGGKYGNPKKVNAKKSLKLKKGKKKKIGAKLICKKKTKTHISKFRYESSNAKIVTVNKKGKIKALKKGKCYIYVYAQNGFFKKIKITVK